MTDYADLEIGLHYRDGQTWRVELRYSQPRPTPMSGWTSTDLWSLRSPGGPRRAAGR